MPNHMEGTVEKTVYIGSDTHLIIHTGSQNLKVWEQNRVSRIDPHAFYSSGQKIQLVILPENALIMKRE